MLVEMILGIAMALSALFIVGVLVRIHLMAPSADGIGVSPRDYQLRVDNAINTIMLYHDEYDDAEDRAWLIDQVMRALTGCTRDIRKIAGFCPPFMADSPEYHDYVASFTDGDEGPRTYEWPTGREPEVYGI